MSDGTHSVHVGCPNYSRRAATVLSVSMLTVTVAAGSLLIGPTAIAWHDVVQSISHYDATRDAQFVIRELRLPRVVLAGMVGGSLAVSGALMQGVTRNPLAGPSIMGLSTGGTFCLLVGLLIQPSMNYDVAILLSLLGALAGFTVVCSVALLSPRGMTPTGFALAGAVVSALFGAITHGLTIYFSLHDEMLFWTVGGVSHVTWNQVLMLAPVFVVGGLLALSVSRSVTVLSLGNDVAASLGQHHTWIRLTSSVAVLLLTGGSIAVAGPVGFVGVMVPHLARMLIGADYRWILPMSFVMGVCLTVSADMGARLLGGGREVPLGLFTTLLGAPFFVFLARRPAAVRRLEH